MMDQWNELLCCPRCHNVGRVSLSNPNMPKCLRLKTSPMALNRAYAVRSQLPLRSISRRYRKAALGAVVEFGSVLIQSEKCREHDIKFIAVFESAQNGDCGICYPCRYAPSFACR
jgi:hypothetical protein